MDGRRREERRRRARLIHLDARGHGSPRRRRCIDVHSAVASAAKAARGQSGAESGASRRGGQRRLDLALVELA